MKIDAYTSYLYFIFSCSCATPSNSCGEASFTANPPPPPSASVVEKCHIDMHDVYMDAKLQYECAKAKLRLEKKRQREDSHDRKLEKKLKEELAVVKARVKQENADQKSHQYIEKDVDMDSESDSDEACESIYINTTKQQHNVVEKWQRGHQKAALKAAQEGLVLAATVPTL